MKFLITLFLIGSSALAQGRGGRVGNGGDAVVCYSNSSKTMITSIDLLDYWEQKTKEINFGYDAFTVDQNIKLFIQRLSSIDPMLAQSTATIANSIAANINLFLKNQNDLPEIEDANPQTIPSEKNCYIEQFAIQWRNLMTQERRFYISERLYNDSKTSNVTRAGLILHEALYRQAVLNGAENSDGVRAFNYAVASDLVNHSSLDNYFYFLSAADLNLQKCRPELFYGSINIFFKNEKFSFKKNCFNGEVLLNPLIKVKYNDSTVTKYAIDTTDPYYVFSHVQLYKKQDLQSHFNEQQSVFAYLDLNKSLLSINLKSPVVWNLFQFQLNHVSGLSCQGDIVYNIITQQVMSCDIQPQAAVFSKYSLNINNRIERDEKGHLKTNLVQNQMLHISETNSEVEVFGGAKVILNSIGELVQGHLNRPYIYMFEGKPFSTDYISLDTKSFIDLSYEEIIPSNKNQMRILMSENYDYMNLCKESSFVFDRHQVKSQSEYISVPEYFYNSITQKSEYKVDENVEYIQEIKCQASKQIRLEDLL
jgi:hypothetical protein